MSFLLIFSTSFMTYAKDCSGDFELFGRVEFKYRNEDKSITIKKEKSKFPAVWNINSDQFDELVIVSKKEISSVDLEIKNQKKESIVKKFPVIKQDDGYQIKDFSFKKKISALKSYPYEMNLNVVMSETDSCFLKFILKGGD